MTLTFENVCQGDRSGLYTAKQASISEFFFILAVLYFSFENVCQGDRSGLYTVKQASISEWQFFFYRGSVFFLSWQCFCSLSSRQAFLKIPHIVVLLTCCERAANVLLMCC